MTDPIITLVLSHNLGNAWPHCMPLLKPAVDRLQTHTIEDVRKSLFCNQAHLWLQWSNEKGEAAAVTEFVNYPQGLWLRIWLMGAARGAQVLWDQFEKAIIGFAADNNCAGIEHYGRKGWAKRYPGTDTETRIYRHAFNGGKS